MKNNSDVQYATYSRAILSELKDLADLIRKYSNATKEKDNALSITPILLSTEQINLALSNPQNAIKPGIVAHAILIKLHRDIIANLEQADIQRRLMRENIAKLRERLPGTAEIQKEELSESIAALENMQKKTNALQKQLQEREKEVEKLRAELSKFTIDCDHDWDVYREFYLKALVIEIEQAEVPLTELEKAEILSQDSLPEVLHRFQTLNIDIPSQLNTEKLNFVTYFKLKGYLAIHASLSRRLLPTKPEDILKILKRLLKG